MRVGNYGQVEFTINNYLILFVILWLLAGLPLQSLFLFLIVLSHEFVHLLTAWLCGLKVLGVELYPFGGTAKLKEPPEWYPKKEIVVAAAGPIFNMLLAVFLIFFLYENAPNWLKGHIFFLAKASLAMACFNMLPALPLDGGRILRAILTMKKEYRRAAEVATRLGKLFGVFFFVTGLILAYEDYLYLTVSLMGLFLYQAAHKEREKAVYTFLRLLSRKEREIQKQGLITGRELVAFEDTRLSQVLRAFRPQHYHLIWVLDRSCRVKGWLSETEVLETAWKSEKDLPLKHISSQDTRQMKRNK